MSQNILHIRKFTICHKYNNKLLNCELKKIILNYRPIDRNPRIARIRMIFLLQPYILANP